MAFFLSEKSFPTILNSDNSLSVCAARLIIHSSTQKDDHHLLDIFHLIKLREYKTMNKPKLDNYKKALKTLDEAMENAPVSLLERDGSIQRFEYCLEVSWNSAKKVLEFHEFKSETPRNIFRELARIGWIDNPDSWIEFLEARNKTSHIYHEEVAKELYSIIPKFLKASHQLLSVLEEKLK